MFDFGDINPLAGLDVPRLMIPAPLLRLMRRGTVEQSESWLRHNTTHPWLSPHRVTLMVQENMFSVDLKPVTYFIRCPRYDSTFAALSPQQRQAEAVEALASGVPVPNAVDPQIAAYTANMLWTKWEKPEPAPGQPPAAWPDTVNKADILEIDESDWVEYLKAAHKHGKQDTYFCAGPPRFPLYWTCTGLAFLDDQELHEHEHYDLLGGFAGDHTRNTRGGMVE